MGGVLPPPGETIWEQSRFIAEDQSLRNFVLNEPRGGVFRHVNLLVPGETPGCGYRLDYHGAKRYTPHVRVQFDVRINGAGRHRDGPHD